MKCKVCKQEAEWAWQPFGPSDDTRTSFTSLGWHYRGFPVVKTCDECKKKFEQGETLTFTYKKVEYTANLKDGVKPVDNIKTYATIEEAEEAMARGETVRIEFKPEDINPALIDLAHDLQQKERFEEWKANN